ncbi:hypothetical protein MFS40622_1687 [Methanocaldococcus sp. FS406-22]|uniref:hypothetical protein n=1 Tax=Methanocaldococcus sp. (strain FS406-22) TaxID=644281 RepID=UPI0001BF3E9F|nr:hypothetical protein [Methanocaldococcus sp. FS406-22]ADC70358.1 hypothetical protein MFS40622_1687 [Methanocaldococcus sp. FS406-22]
MKKPLILFFIILTLIINHSSAQTVVVGSDQDKTLVYQLSEHLNATPFIIPWGSTDEKYVNELKNLNATEIIIIGGKYSVPECFNIGNYKRFAGKDRVETAYLVLSNFYNINCSGNLIFYPSKELILKTIIEKRNWIIIEGNSPISKKWSKFIYYSLKKDHHGNKTVIYVGNINNNPQMRDNWNIKLPYIVSFCPAVIYYNNTLYITGSDENLPSTIGRLFAKHITYEFNDLLLFFIILLITSAIFYYYIRSPYYIVALIISALWIFWHKYDFGIVWDALFVYLDGALSLLYLGHYETIISGRSFCGLSYCLYVWFHIFKPSLESIVFYQIYMFFIMVGFIFLYFKRKFLGLIVMLILLGIPLFKKYILMFSTELTFLTFLMIILHILKNFKGKNLEIIILSLLTSISALVRVHSLAIPLIYAFYQKNKQSLLYLMLSIVLYLTLLFISGGEIYGYVGEISTKGGISLDIFIKNVIFYLPKFLMDIAFPITVLLTLFIIKREKIIKNSSFKYYILTLAVVFLIMPLFWVAQEERYLLTSVFLFTVAGFEFFDY